jgi:hypothetical protein
MELHLPMDQLNFDVACLGRSQATEILALRADAPQWLGTVESGQSVLRHSEYYRKTFLLGDQP